MTFKIEIPVFVTKVNASNRNVTKWDIFPWDIFKSDNISLFIKKYWSIQMTFEIESSQFYY